MKEESQVPFMVGVAIQEQTLVQIISRQPPNLVATPLKPREEIVVLMEILMPISLNPLVPRMEIWIPLKMLNNFLRCQI
jgi:hypothetical protein